MLKRLAKVATGATAAAIVVSTVPMVGSMAAGTVDIVPKHKDGTAPFSSQQIPGEDVGENNNIVRTNDLVTYTPEVTTGDDAFSGGKLTIKLPQGVHADSYPAFCGEGSSLSPQTIAEPGINLTADSWKSLPQQTITCMVGDQAANVTQTFPFPAKVRPEVPNGAYLAPVEYSFESSNAIVVRTLDPLP